MWVSRNRAVGARVTLGFLGTVNPRVHWLPGPESQPGPNVSTRSHLVWTKQE